MLAGLLSANVFAFFLVFARIGTAFMLLPGFGDAYVGRRVRLMMALAVAAALTPVVSDTMPGLPDQPLHLFFLLAGEIIVGAFLGTAANLLAQSLQIAGMMISYQAGLANATLFNPLMAQQSSLIGTFLSIVGTILLFATNLHHLLLQALVDSYELFVPGVLMPVGDFSQVIARLVADAFKLAFQLATPFFVFGILFYVGLGLLARLMPQMQVFFIALPLQIILTLLLLTISVSAMMLWYLDNFEATFVGILKSP